MKNNVLCEVVWSILGESCSHNDNTAAYVVTFPSSGHMWKLQQ